ncbi:MAG: flavin reductase [Clostridiales bacterium]|nr:flavin reductase [Clostridiales bacterium]
MAKVPLPISNDYCPQTLFLYGTYGADRSADFGLFCWFSYAWDGGLRVMACIGGEKLTKERIHASKVFSANLVTEAILPLADHFGNVEGRNPAKMAVDATIERGRALDVPILSASPLAFELEVERFIPLDDGEVMLCRIHGVLGDESLAGASTPAEKLAAIAPVSTTCAAYFGWDGRNLGAWGAPMKALGR